jgi:hypothetical protein
MLLKRCRREGDQRERSQCATQRGVRQREPYIRLRNEPLSKVDIRRWWSFYYWNEIVVTVVVEDRAL